MMKERKSVPRSSPMSFLFVWLIVLTKSTKVIAALKVLKFGKPLVTVISMLISAIMYGIWLGPWFGVGLVAMLFIHEMGHIIALRFKGFETNGPVFIPFLGAAIFAPKFDDRDTEAFVGYGGPLLGTIAALMCFAAWYVTGQTSEILLLVSYVGVFLNLFNLIPVSPLDGGRITQAVGPWFKYLGLVILVLYTLTTRQPSLLLIWILVLDGFESLTLWLRPSLAGFFTVSMGVLMVLGYGNQPIFLNCVDIGLADLFVLVFWARDEKRKREGIDPQTDVRDYPSGAGRTKWLVCYLGLALLTSSVIFVQGQYLPHAVKSNNGQTASPPALIQ